MQTPNPEEYEEKHPEDDPIDDPVGPVGVYPFPETKPQETGAVEEAWIAEEVTESPEATYSAPEPGSGDVPSPTYQESPYTSPQQAQAPYSQTPYGQAQRKDKSLAIILEILPAFFGIMGIGWIYGGNTNAGIGWLIGFLVWNAVAVFLDIITLGIFVCVHLPVNIGLIALSAILLNNYTKQNPELFT